MAVGTALTIAGGVTLADASRTSCQTTGLSSAPSGQSLVWQRCFEERVESEEGKGIAMLGLGPGPVLVGGLTLMASGLDADRHDRKNEAAAVAGMAITALGASGLGLGGGLIGWNIGDANFTGYMSLVGASVLLGVGMPLAIWGLSPRSEEEKARDALAARERARKPARPFQPHAGLLGGGLVMSGIGTIGVTASVIALGGERACRELGCVPAVFTLAGSVAVASGGLAMSLVGATRRAEPLPQASFGPGGATLTWRLP